MTQQHPITPPPELVAAWCREADDNEPMFPQVAAKAAQWGADQELEACCEWLDREGWSGESRQLRAARRPKLPMTELSPAAQAVFDAFCCEARSEPHHQREAIAAALQAVADQVAPENPCGDDCCITQCEQIRAELLAIAAELKAHG